MRQLIVNSLGKQLTVLRPLYSQQRLQLTSILRGSARTITPVSTTPVLRVTTTHRALHTTTSLKSSQKPNRLIDEKSPYLLQHAYNPVDWYPWGKAAFEKAKTENKPIFLSIGYSTCHWCHVMEHESFENDKVAKILNDHFVSIKVDREENPGVDKLYMTYVQLTTGRGGWPMSVFLTPDLHPFFGATYFPPDDVGSHPGFKTVLSRVAKVWEESPDALLQNGQDTIHQLQSYVQSRPKDSSDDLDADKIAKDACDHYKSVYDATLGGFSDAPKFPQPVQMNFLLDYYGYTRQQQLAHGDKETTAGKDALDMVLFTLKKISDGGIHDHVGGGFHRYSTDKNWHVPHFEKMLYDQAQLLSTYATAYQITRDPTFATTAKDIIGYVARDLRHSEGGFYSAEDADSLPAFGAKTKLEGAFCVWTQSELESVLDQQQAQAVIRHFGVLSDGNVNPAQDPHGELVNKNVLTSQESLKDTANALNMPLNELESTLQAAKQKLWNYRMEQRPKPHRDEKIITSWNGLMITGLVKAYQVLQDPAILDLATNTANFIHKQLYRPDSNTLLRSYCQGPSTIEGFLDDYSYMIQGLLDLYETNHDEHWIRWAHDLQEKQNELFYDKNGGGYFTVQENDKSILVRLKDEQDGAEPSPNAISLKNLVRLGTILEKDSYVTNAQSTLDWSYRAMSQYPYAMPALVTSSLLMYHGVKQIVLAGNPKDATMQTYQDLVNQAFLPNKLVIQAKGNGFVHDHNTLISKIATSSTEKPTAFICENFTCGLPIQDVVQLKKRLEQ
ncbi:spermatogenesis-associated protein 20 [Chlamydoabsidia padenii]|nr:spermatogenesis-associated protein 20 [Chlamydoabsidia padenii]